MNSHYFGFKKGTIMAATSEIPCAPAGKASDPASGRKYGQAMIRDWVKTPFLPSVVKNRVTLKKQLQVMIEADRRRP